MTTKTITQSQFDSASSTMQDAWLAKGFTIVADSSVAIDLTEPKESAHNEYSIEGDRIWMNIDITIGTHKLRLPSVEITSIYYAQRKLKGQDERIDVTEVMSLVKTIRAHGTEKVNDAMEVSVRFGQQGEKQAEAIDLLS